jgi:hypothetical protein
MDSFEQDSDVKATAPAEKDPGRHEPLNQVEAVPASLAEPGPPSGADADGSVGTSLAQTGGYIDDAIIGALSAISADQTFVDNALAQLTSSVDLFDVASLPSDISSNFFGPDGTG